MSAPVMVVEDDAAARESLLLLLASEGWACLGYADAATLLDDPQLPRAACLVADVRLGQGMDGVALLAALRERGVAVPVVLVTGHGDVPLAVRAMRQGAADFLEKPYGPEQLLRAVHDAVAAGARIAPGDDRVSLAARLTPRERDVLRGLLAGHPNRRVAEQLGISPRTVETYRAAIMEKLQVASFAELVRVALARQIID
jgi:two-component system, LuxR family, response regulator FixJ